MSEFKTRKIGARLIVDLHGDNDGFARQLFEETVAAQTEVWGAAHPITQSTLVQAWWNSHTDAGARGSSTAVRRNTFTQRHFETDNSQMWPHRYQRGQSEVYSHQCL